MAIIDNPDVQRLIQQVEMMSRALHQAADRFENSKFGVNWQDAADDCRKAIKCNPSNIEVDHGKG